MAVKETWKKWFRKDNLVILILSGVLLFIIALPTEEKNTATEAGGTEALRGQDNTNVTAQVKDTDADFIESLEEQLENILAEMAGVGKVKVMITQRSSEELVIEKDEPVSRSNTNENDSAGGTRIVTQMDSAEATVYRTDGSSSEPYVIKTLAPQIEGVVVVAQGAGSGTVNQNITEMIQALFGVEAHKVKVVKMASGK